MLTSSKDKQRVFLTNDTKIENSDSKFDIIVSPEFYWVRKFEIPVKNEKQALKVLPSMFEDIVGSSFQNLTYQAKMIGENLFLAFAFESENIQKAIKNANISLANVANLYFAQNECRELSSFQSNNQTFTYTAEDILVKVPNNLIENTIELNTKLNELNLSSFKLDMQFYSTVLSNKTFYTLLVIFVILTTLNLMQYGSYSNEIDKIEKNIQVKKEQNSLPSSTLQINSIYKKYTTTISKEKQKREGLSYILSNKKFDLKSIVIKNNIIELEYLSANQKNVESFLSKKFKIISSDLGGFLLKVRVQI